MGDENEYHHEVLEGREAFACLLEGLANAVRCGDDVQVVVVYDTDGAEGEVGCHLGGSSLLDAIRMCGEGQIALAGMLDDEMRELEGDSDGE